MKLSKTFKNFLKPRKIFNIVLILLILFLLFKGYNKIFEGNTGQDELVFFYMKNCGHCDRFMPVWDEFVEEVGDTFKTKKIESSEDPKLIDRLKINGFPTILLMNGNTKVKEFKGDRTVDELKNFINIKEGLADITDIL